MTMRYIACSHSFMGICFKVGIRKISSYNLISSGVLSVSNEVQYALRTKLPVVALESTIITHGMPYPDNLSTASAIENVIREANAVPATVAIVNGKINVGLDESQLKYLAKLGNSAIKTSRRDLSYVVSQRLSGGTTVSSTMIAAHLCGISTFVTGGIGGVHRGAAETFDVSADLTELGRTPVNVICAGVKSILDIGLTLEYLETMGVPVICYGESREFPAFFTRESGYQAPFSLKTPREIASVIAQNQRMSLQSGMVVAVPIPEEYVCDGLEIERCIQSALQQARDVGVSGKEVTPFVLDKVNKLSEGKSLVASNGSGKTVSSTAAKLAQAKITTNSLLLKSD